MSHRYFSFYFEDTSYDEIEEWCSKNGYSVLKGDIAKKQYLKRYFNSSGDHLVFIIETYIYIYKPDSLRQPESQGSVENIMFGPLADKCLELQVAVAKGDTSKQAEYDKVKAEYGELKEETDKIYLSVKRKFGKSSKEISARREEIIASRKERGLDSLGNPIKTGLLKRIFK